MRSAALGLRFLLELALLAALAFWGFTTPDGALLKILLGVGAPVLAAAVWGMFLSPRAAMRVPGPRLVILEMALFAVAAMALSGAGQLTLAVVLAIAAVAQRVTLSVLGAPAGLTGER
jgi:hypothetical protein